MVKNDFFSLNLELLWAQREILNVYLNKLNSIITTNKFSREEIIKNRLTFS